MCPRHLARTGPRIFGGRRGGTYRGPGETRPSRRCPRFEPRRLSDVKLGSARNTVSSLPMLRGECASENETIDRESTSGTLQFMAGSLDRPVSMAGMRFAASPKALFSRVESRLRPVHAVPGCPHVGRNHNAPFVGVPRSPRHVSRRHLQHGPPVGRQVLYLGEATVYVFNGLKIGRPDQKVHPAALVVLTPYARNLGGEDEPGAVSRVNTFVVVR